VSGFRVYQRHGAAQNCRAFQGWDSSSIASALRPAFPSPAIIFTLLVASIEYPALAVSSEGSAIHRGRMDVQPSDAAVHVRGSAERSALRRRTLTLVASLPCLLYLAAWSSVQESPRWLLISGRKVAVLGSQPEMPVVYAGARLVTFMHDDYHCPFTL
jgi:hypothetical protein